MYHVLDKLTICFSTFTLLFMLYFSISIPTLTLAQDNSELDSIRSVPQKPLVVLFTIFGIDNGTGDILGFVTVNNHTDYKIIQSMGLKHVATGIGQFEISSNSSMTKVGDQYNACIVLLKSMQRDCIISYKLPYIRVEQIGFSIKSLGPF